MPMLPVVLGTATDGPALVDLHITQGDSASLVFEIHDTSPPVPANLTDLTGFSAYGAVRDGYGGALLLEFKTADGTIVVDALLGTITIYASAAVTAALVTGQIGRWDMQVIGGGAIQTMFRGKVYVEPQIAL